VFFLAVAENHSDLHHVCPSVYMKDCAATELNFVKFTVADCQ